MIVMTALAHSSLLPGLLAQVQTSLPPPGADYMRILPELVLSIFGMLVMVVGAWRRQGSLRLRQQTRQ